MKLRLFYIFFIALLVLPLTESIAQNNNRSFFSVTAGYSLPVGELAREKLDDPFAGLTGSGYYGQASYDFRVTRWLGLKLSGSMNLNKTKPEPIIERANEAVEQIKPLINETSSHSWQSHVSKWKFNTVMIGPALYLNFNKVQFEAHVQGGYVQVTSPTVEMAGAFESGQNNMTVRLSPASTKDFGVGAGASLRVPLGNTLYFHVSGDFLATEAELKDVAIRVNVGNYPEFAVPINEKRFVGVANVGVGFGIMF